MTDHDLPEYVILKINITSYNNILKSSIRSAKQMHYTHIFNKLKNNTRKTIQEILSKTQKKISKNSFREGERVITDKMEIENYFNTFFTNIGPSLAFKFRNDSDNNFNYCLKRNSTITFKFTEIDEETIEGFSLKTSNGVDKIYFKQLKYIKLALTKPTTLITKQTLNTGILPDKLKIAKVIPIFKSGAITSASNFQNN